MTACGRNPNCSIPSALEGHCQAQAYMDFCTPEAQASATASLVALVTLRWVTFQDKCAGGDQWASSPPQASRCHGQGSLGGDESCSHRTLIRTPLLPTCPRLETSLGVARDPSTGTGPLRALRRADAGFLLPYTGSVWLMEGKQGAFDLVSVIISSDAHPLSA